MCLTKLSRLSNHREKLRRAQSQYLSELILLVAANSTTVGHAYEGGKAVYQCLPVRSSKPLNCYVMGTDEIMDPTLKFVADKR